MENQPKQNRGRPFLPDEERLDVTCRFRLTAAQRTALAAAATRAGVEVSEYIRAKLFDDMGEVRE